MTRKMGGLAQIPLIIGLVIMAIAVPVATRLVEENQDTRRSAASVDDAKFNGIVWDKVGRWKPGDDCDAREGVLSISSSRGQVAWQGDHFDVINNEKNKSVTVILTPPTACGYECDTWRIVERGEDPIYGVGCEIEFVPTTEDWASGVEFFLKYVSTPTPTPTPALPNASNFSVNPSTVNVGDSVEVSFTSSHVGSGEMVIYYRKVGDSSWTAWEGGDWLVSGHNVTVGFAGNIVPSLLGTYEVGVAVYNTERTAVCSSNGNIYWVVDGVVGQDSGEDCDSSLGSLTVGTTPVPTDTPLPPPWPVSTNTPTPTPILPDSSGEFFLSRTTVSGGDRVRLDFYGIRAGDQILYYKLGGGSWVEGGSAPVNSPSMPDSAYFDAPSVAGVYDVGVAIYNVAGTAVCSSNGKIYWVNDGVIDSQTDTGETCNNRTVSLTVGAALTPTPTGCPPEEVYSEARELAINTYCTNALGSCDGSWATPLECHVSEDGWGPFGSDCTDAYCTGCECVTSAPTPDGSVTKFNGVVVNGSERWRNGNNCSVRKGVSIEVENGSVTWMSDDDGGHFDVHDSLVGTVQRVTLTPPTSCGFECATWQVVDASNGNAVLEGGSGCVAEFTQPGGGEWATNVQFYLRPVSATVVPTVAPTLTGCPPEAVSSESRELAVNTYCTNALGSCDGSWAIPLECHASEDGWGPFGNDCTDPYCTGCECLTPTPTSGLKRCDEDCLIDSDCRTGYFCSDVIAALTGRLVCRNVDCEAVNVVDANGDCICPTPIVGCLEFCRDGEELPGAAEGTFRGSCDEPVSVAGQVCTVVSNHGDSDVNDCGNCICSICRTDVTPMPTRTPTPTNVPGQPTNTPVPTGIPTLVPTNTSVPSGCPVLEGTLAEVEFWRSDYIEGETGTIERNDWQADFVGLSDGTCDGFVDIDDFEAWREKYMLNL